MSSWPSISLTRSCMLAMPTPILSQGSLSPGNDGGNSLPVPDSRPIPRPSACFAPRCRTGWQCFDFVQGWLFVGAVDGCRLSEGRFCLGNFSQINERETQAIFVSRVANVVGFEQWRRGLEILNRLRVVLFLQLYLAERPKR